MSVSPQLKVGLFVLVVLVVLAYATIRISQTAFLATGSYQLFIETDNAVGIAKKTPVQIAGIQVGHVSKIQLLNNNRARLTLTVKKGVAISDQVEAQIKTLGFLGDTYIDLYQPGPMTTPLQEGGVIMRTASFGDFNSLTGQLGDIANDVKAITATMRKLMAGDDSSFAKSLGNIEKITDALGDVSVKNRDNMHAIIANFRTISENLNAVIAQNRRNIDQSLEDVAAITGKVRSGEGTIGRLVYDEATVDKLNDTIDNVNDLLGGVKKLQVDIGYHGEYLGETADFKNYISLALKPVPDKYFLFEFVSDPAPDTKFVTKNTAVTSGGVTNRVTEEIETTNANGFLFSAQLAKKLYDFTIRGGLIESSGGVGLDYDYGPVGVQLSAFDLETKRGERPHLKAMGTVNLTRNFYLLGGMDDFISKKQDPDWFMGAGLTMTDDDIKSLIGLLSVKP